MTADTNDAVHMCAIPDVENRNAFEGSSSSINQSSTEDDNEEQGSDSKNNVRNFVFKYGSGQSGDRSTLQHSGRSPYRVDAGDAQAYLVFLLLSVSGLAGHAAFKQRQRQQQEEEIQKLLEQYASNEERSSITAGSVASTETKDRANSATTSTRSKNATTTTGSR